MGNRDSSVQILDGGARQPFVYSPLDDISQLSHPPWQHTLCITDREAKNRHEKKIKLPCLQIRSFFFVASADDVDSASKINADEQFTGSAKFFSKYGRHNTCEWIYLKVVLLHRRAYTPSYFATGYLTRKQGRPRRIQANG